MKEHNKSNKKFFWGILLAVVTILLCYMFVVLYFFYISPNNIKTKFTLWPFLSDKDIGETYLDATMEIRFNSDDLENSEHRVIGVTVREDGFVLAPYHQFKNFDGGDIKLYSNFGKIFDGELVFAEENFDLAVLKCTNPENKSAAVKLPFVSVGSSAPRESSGVFSISSPMDAHHIWKGKVESYSSDASLTVQIEGFTAVDFVIESGTVIGLESSAEFSDGAVFDSYGNLLGFSYAQAIDSKANFVTSSAKNANLFLKNVCEAYKKQQHYENNFANAFSGIDHVEICKHYDVSDQKNGMPKCFFFKNQWFDYSATPGIRDFYSSTMNSDGFFLLEDFIYGEEEIEKYSIVTAIKAGGNTTEIKTKNDLFELAYKLKSGQRIQIEFISILDSQTKTINLTV